MENIKFIKDITLYIDKPRAIVGNCIYYNLSNGNKIKLWCEEMGVEDTINSPTFAIVNEYEDRDMNTIYHFDFYRIKSVEEVYNMGYEEYLYSDAVCFMEWPELVEELLPEECIRVEIDEENDGSRRITIIRE